MLKINDLSKTSATLYRSYAKANDMELNQAKQIMALCEQGKAGHAEIMQIAQLLKDNAEANGHTLKQATAKIRTQTSRALNTLKTGLSLQGLGKDQAVVIAPKASADTDAVGPVIAGPRDKPENSVEPNTKSITSEQAWDFVEQYYTLDEVQALLGAVKARIKSGAKVLEKVA